MKKLIIVLAVGIIATDSMAQTSKKLAPPPQDIPIPLPPPPPPAPPEMVEFTPTKIVKNAPPPPKPPVVRKVKFTPPIIVNEKGYTILVKSTTAEPIILLKKKGMTQKIRMSVWNAKPQYFENKYGKLPPPPPPAPSILSEKE